MSLKEVLKPKPSEQIKKEIDDLVKSFDLCVFKEIIGKTIKNIEKYDDDNLYFNFTTGEKWHMYHEQNCCERVHIEDIIGDLDDLVGSPLIIAEERTGKNPHASESGTWTFYAFATLKGYVDIRWNGESNGYYSEAVSFYDTSKYSEDEFY